MATVTTGNSATITLNEGLVVTITTDPNTTGTVARTFINDGNDSQTVTEAIGPPAMNSLYGPYDRSCTMVITSKSGTITYTTSGSSAVSVAVDSVTGSILSASSSGESLLQAAAMVARSKGNVEIISKGEAGGASSTSVVGYTWQRVVALRGVPLIARVQYVNPTATAYTVSKTNIKLSTSFVSGVGGGDPTGAMTPLNVLWSGGASIAVGTGAGTVDAPEYSAWSDALFIPTVTRSDAGTYPLAYIRSYLANGGATAYPYHAAITNYPNNSVTGLVRQNAFKSGDFVATPTGFDTNNGVALLMNLEFTEFCRGIKIVSLGDSLTSNNGTNPGLGIFDRNFVDIALSSINSSTVSYGTILSHSNCGVGSTNLDKFLGRLPTILTQQTPDVVIIPVWSPNSSPTTQALLDGNNAYVLQAISRILATGAVPILWTSPPQNSTTAAIDALRISNNNYWKNIATANGFYLVDCASVCDGSVVGGVTQWATGLTTDGTHWNELGNTSVAALFVPIIKAACGLV
jgi:hypothetical protein